MENKKILNGIIPIFKEKGFTSFYVVAKLKGILGQKKVGHAGTLDPIATGVLPICVGKATKLSEYLMDSKKEYIAEFVLGLVTDTQDITGEILEKKEYNNLAIEEVVDTIKSFVGEYMQEPPMYSALKINGQKLYNLARKGVVVDRKKRRVHIYYIEDIKIDDFPKISMRVGCSKGTYIRTLIHDIGQKLSVGACMTSLLRSKSSGFKLNECFTLEKIQEKIDKIGGNEFLSDDISLDFIIKIDEIFYKTPCIYLNNKGLKYVKNGNRIFIKDVEDISTNSNIDNILNIIHGDKIRLYTSENKEFAGLYKYNKNGFFESDIIMY